MSIGEVGVTQDRGARGAERETSGGDGERVVAVPVCVCVVVAPHPCHSDPRNTWPASLGFPHLPHQSTQGERAYERQGRERGVIGPAATGA